MILWRISRHRDLSGNGGLKASGRWHTAGQPVVYLAGSPAGALLEVCVHTSAGDVPSDFTLLRIDGPAVRVATIQRGRLPHDWTTRTEATREIGTAWLRKNVGVLLRIPSALVPETVNYLFNPRHPDAAKFRIAGEYPYPFDARLKT